jgi:hypothetical protein
LSCIFFISLSSLFRYLIDTRWFKQLTKYLGLDLESGSSSEGDPSAHPGPIDNSPLFKNEPDESGEPFELREHMIDELDFVLTPEDAWALLLEEFTLTQGQEPIARKVNNFPLLLLVKEILDIRRKNSIIFLRRKMN